MKWVSLLHHIQDKHEWLSGKCEHSPLTDLPTDSTGNTIAYFNRNDKDFQALSKVVRNKQWLETMKYYQNFGKQFN